MSNRPHSTRHLEMVRCENCGEDYSATYKRCPFCDERPHGLFAGRRVDSRAGRNPLQLVGLIASLVLIIAALFIVFTKISPLLLQQDPPTPGNSDPSTEQTEPISPSTPEDTQPEVSQPENIQPEPPTQTSPVVISAVTLSRTDFTLVPGEIFSLSVSVIPADADVPVTWTSSDPAILSVDSEGTVTNKNTTGQTAVVTVTATCGGLSAECTVRCRSEEVPGVTPEDPAENENNEPQAPSGSGSSSGSGSGSTSGTKVNREATVVNADSGLNIRSGPGSSYEKIASAANGSSVKVLEDCGGGWYKIDYGNGKVGYASSSFIKLK